MRIGHLAALVGRARRERRAGRAAARGRRSGVRRRRRRGRGSRSDARRGRDEDGALPTGRIPRRPRHDLLDAWARRPHGRRALRSEERRGRGRDERRAALRHRHASGIEDDPADRRGAGGVRLVRGDSRSRGAVHQGRDRRERAEPEPLLAPAVRARRLERVAGRVPRSARTRLRRAEGGVTRRHRVRRRRLAARRRQPRRLPPDALADQVHPGARCRVPGVRTKPADHGRVRHPPVRRQLEPGADGRAPARDLDRRRGLREARVPPRPGVRRHCAARIDAADPVRRVRRRVADPVVEGEPLLRHRAGDDEARRPRRRRPATTSRRWRWRSASPTSPES